MRRVERLPEIEDELRISEDRLGQLGGWVNTEIEDALSSRTWQEDRWKDNLRRYEAVPKNPNEAWRQTPIEGLDIIEVPLGAIATDAIYAQELSLIFQTSPILTVRATNSRWIEHAKAIQRLANICATQSNFNLRSSAEEVLLDSNKLGSGFYYIPWTENIKRTSSQRVLNKGPRIRALPPEDFLAPGGSYDDFDEVKWAAMRIWYTQVGLNDQAEHAGWTLDGTMPVGHVDPVRQQRQRLGLTQDQESRNMDLFEIWQIWAYFDIDEDGEAEDLLIVWDRTGRRILKVSYNPYDRRPFAMCRYQRRGHLLYGMGVMDITRPNQQIATDNMNYWLANAFLANARMWLAAPDTGLSGTMRAWIGRVITSNNPQGLQPLVLADVYPSLPQLFLLNISMTEKRTGISDISTAPGRSLGNRTPGITALSLLQQANQRFTPAFDSARFGTAGAVRQCLFRFQERLLAGDVEVERYLFDVLGDQEAPLAIEVMRNPQFDDALAVELTASSASINREADRQNSILLANLLGQYYTRTIELINLSANPQVPQQVRDVAEKVASAAGEVIERTIRTFDQVRDPEAFIINIQEELAQVQQGMPQNAINQLIAGLGAAEGGTEQPFGVPAEAGF